MLLIFTLNVCRQSSDPRSGYATVETDLGGGLTPMLGDKKVRKIGLSYIYDGALAFLFP